MAGRDCNLLPRLRGARLEPNQSSSGSTDHYLPRIGCWCTADPERALRQPLREAGPSRFRFIAGDLCDIPARANPLGLAHAILFLRIYCRNWGKPDSGKHRISTPKSSFFAIRFAKCPASVE